jgi:hypothetical protein
MKKLIPLMIAMALTFGAVTAFSHSNNSAPQKKGTGKKGTGKKGTM